MLDEITQAIADGKTVTLSARIDIKHDKIGSAITLILSKQKVQKDEDQKHVAFGVSFSIKDFLESLKTLESLNKLSVRKTASDTTNVYLLDSDNGDIQATITVKI